MSPLIGAGEVRVRLFLLCKMSPNGTALCLPDRAQALAQYPHARIANGFIYVSGISSRRLDNTYEGVTEMPDGSLQLDIRAQTKAVIQKYSIGFLMKWFCCSIQAILQAAGADLENIVDMTCFLVNMEDYAGFNETYNLFFKKDTGMNVSIEV